MTSRSIHDDFRHETGSAESVFWRKSRHSATGPDAACVEVVSAVQRPDGSVTVETPGRQPFVLVQAPSDHLLADQRAEQSAQSGEPWTRGSRDDTADTGVDTHQPDQIKTAATPDLENAHGLPGFGDTRADDPVSDSSKIPSGSGWLDPKSSEYDPHQAAVFYQEASENLKHTPWADTTHEELRKIYDEVYPDNGENRQGGAQYRGFDVARNIADLRAKGGAPSASRIRHTFRDLLSPHSSSSGSSQRPVAPTVSDADKGRAQNALARGATLKSIEADPLRALVKGSFPDQAGKDLVDDKLSDDNFKENFPESLGHWQASSDNGTKISVHVLSLSEPRDSVEEHGDITSSSALEKSSSSSTDKQTSDPLNPTKVGSIKTPWVNVSPRFEGIGNHTESTVSAAHTHSESTSYTRPDALIDVAEHTAVVQVRVEKPAESHLSIPGVHHEPEVETHTLALPVKVGWPHLDAGADPHDVQLSYPKLESGATADQRAAVLREKAKQIEETVGVKVVADDLEDAVNAAVGPGHEDEVSKWVHSLKELRERDGQSFERGQLEHTFGSGGSASTVRIFPKARPGEPGLMSKLVDKSDQIRTTHSTEEKEFSHSESKDRSVGGELKVESGSGFVAGNVGIDVASTHTHTDSHESAAKTSHEVTDKFKGPVSTLEAHSDLVVYADHPTGKSVAHVVSNALIEVKMRDRSVSPPPGQRPATPSHMPTREAPDSIHAVYKLDEPTVEELIGPALVKLEHGIPVPGKRPTVVRLAPERLHQVKQDLVKLIQDKTKDYLDGDENNYGDGVRYELPDGLGTLVLRGEMDRGAGAYHKPLVGHERDEVLTMRAKQALTRSRADRDKLTATGGGNAGVVSLTGELGVSRDRTAGDGYKLSVQEQQVWHSSSTWHRYDFPVRSEIDLERGGDSVSVVKPEDSDDVHASVQVSVPERPGVGLPGRADAPAREETEWEPKASDAPDPKATPLPARIEIDELKPMRQVRGAAVDAVKEALAKIPKNKLPHNAEKAINELMQSKALTDWAGSESRLGNFPRTSGPKESADRLTLQDTFKGLTHAIDHHVKVTFELHTEHSNPQVTDRDDEHPITRIQGVSTDLSSHKETVHGFEGDLTAGPSDTASVLGLGGASAEAKAGFHRGTAESGDRSTVEQTTQTHQGRAYLTQYDAKHTIIARIHFDGALGLGRGVDSGPAEHEKSVPGASKVWVEAADIRDAGLPAEEMAKLAPEDQPGYQDTRPALETPGEEGEGLGTLEQHRSKALTEMLDHVNTELKNWAKSGLQGKDKQLVGRFDELRASTIRQISEQARSGGYTTMTTDGRYGGLAFVVRDEHAESGKTEQLVVLRYKLGNGRYYDSLDELTTTTSYTVTRNHQTEKSDTFSTKATVGGKASSDGFGALAREAVPSLSGLGDKKDELLDKLPSVIRDVADDKLDEAKDALDDKLGDKLSPGLKAEASHRTAKRQGGGETSTVNMTRTGPAHRFVYELHIEVDVHPWAHDGLYEDPIKSFFIPHSERHDVVEGVWRSGVHTIPDAVRLTIHDEDYDAARQVKNGFTDEGSGQVRSQPGWKGLSDDAFVQALPFEAPQLHKHVDELIDSGVHIPEAQEMVNAFRGGNLLLGTSATQLRHHFAEGLSPSGHRTEVNSKSLKAVTTKLDAADLRVIKKLDASSADQLLSRTTADHSESSTKGGASLGLSSDGPKLGLDGEHKTEQDAPKPADAGPAEEKALYLVHGTLGTSMTHEYRPGHAPSGTAKTKQAAAEKFRPDGPLWLVANRKGLEDLGAAVPVEHSPDVEVTVEPATPPTHSPHDSAPGSPTTRPDDGTGSPTTRPNEGTGSSSRSAAPRGSKWLDETSDEYKRNPDLAKNFYGEIDKQLKELNWTKESTHEEQRAAYDKLYPDDGTNYQDGPKARASKVAQTITAAKLKGAEDGDTRADDPLSDSSKIPSGSGWLDPKSSEYDPHQAAFFYDEVNKNLKGTPWENKYTHEELRKIYDEVYPDNGENRQGGAQYRGFDVARNIADLRAKGGVRRGRGSNGSSRHGSSSSSSSETGWRADFAQHKSVLQSRIAGNKTLSRDKDFKAAVDKWMDSVRDDLRLDEREGGREGYAKYAADTQAVDRIIAGLQRAHAFGTSANLRAKFQGTPGWEDRMQPIADAALERAGLWSKTGTFVPATEADWRHGVILESSDAGALWDRLLFGSSRYDVSPTMSDLWEKLSSTYASSLHGHVTAIVNTGLTDKSVFYTTEWPRISQGLADGRLDGMTVEVWAYDLDGSNGRLEGSYLVRTQADFDNLPRADFNDPALSEMQGNVNRVQNELTGTVREQLAQQERELFDDLNALLGHMGHSNVVLRASVTPPGSRKSSGWSDTRRDSVLSRRRQSTTISSGRPGNQRSSTGGRSGSAGSSSSGSRRGSRRTSQGQYGDMPFSSSPPKDSAWAGSAYDMGHMQSALPTHYEYAEIGPLDYAEIDPLDSRQNSYSGSQYSPYGYGPRWTTRQGEVGDRLANDPAESAIRPQRTDNPVSADDIDRLRQTVPPRLVQEQIPQLREWFGGDRGVPQTVIDSYKRAGLDTTDLRAAGSRPVVQDVSHVAFDHRVLETPDGRRVQHFSRVVHLDAKDPEAREQQAAFESAVRDEFSAMMNQGFLHDGDQLHFELSFTDDPAKAHATVSLSGDEREVTTTNSWSVAMDPRVAVHESLHGFGLHDESVEPPTKIGDGAETQPVDRRSGNSKGVFTDDSIMAHPAGSTDGLPGKNLYQRHADTITDLARDAHGATHPGTTTEHEPIVAHEPPVPQSHETPAPHNPAAAHRPSEAARPIHTLPSHELLGGPHVEPVTGRNAAPTRFSSAPTGVGWAHARWAKSWGLDFDAHPGSAYDALFTAGGGHDMRNAGDLQRSLGDQIGKAEPSAEDWSHVAENLGSSVLILHSDGTMSAHGSGPTLVIAETHPEGTDGTQRWVGLPKSSEGPALSGLSAAQVHWAASEDKRFAGSGDGFFNALTATGRGSEVPELDYEPQAYKGRLVNWMDTDLSDTDLHGILEQAGIQGPHDPDVKQQTIEKVRQGGGGELLHTLLPLLVSRHSGVGVQVVHTNGDVRTHGEPNAERSVTLAPAAGSHDDSWFGVSGVRPAHTAGAGTRPADVAGGHSWADAKVPVTEATDHTGPEPSFEQEDWAYDHNRQLVEIPQGPHAQFDAILRAAGGGVAVKGEYVSDPARLRTVLADEVEPALKQDLGLALVVHTIYAAHTPSGDALIDSGRAQEEITEAIRNPDFRPDLADEIVPYLTHRIGLGVRTVAPSGVVGRYGSGRPTYVTRTTDANGRPHWTAALPEPSKHTLDSPLRSPNQSDPALFSLNHAINARKNALRASGTNDFEHDPVVGLLHDAQSSWLAHGPAPRSDAGEPSTESRSPRNLKAAADQIVQSVRDSTGGTGRVDGAALGSGLHTGMAIKLFDGLFPHGIGHEPGTGGAAEGDGRATGLPADKWVTASVPELEHALPEDGAALLLGNGRTTVLVDTPDGLWRVDFGSDKVGGPITARVGTPESASERDADGLALVVDGSGHPVPAEHLGEHPDDFDSATGWNRNQGAAKAHPGSGAPEGVSGRQANWARDHEAGFTSVEHGSNAMYKAAIDSAGGVLRGHDGTEVTDPLQLRQVLGQHLLEKAAAPNSLRDLPSVHAAFDSEGAHRVIEEFFSHDPSSANAEAVHKQLDEHISSGKAAHYVSEAVTEPNHWEEVAEPIGLDLLADWSGHSVLSVDPHGQVRQHGDPEATRIAVGRVEGKDGEPSGWVGLRPDHADAQPFHDADVHSKSSLTSRDSHAADSEDSFYHAVLEASGGAMHIDRDTLVSTPDELKQQLSKLVLDRPDLLDKPTRESIEQETGIGAHEGVDKLIDALNHPTSHTGEAVARHVIGSHLGKKLDVVEHDGAEKSYGTGRPIKITSTTDEHGVNHWAAAPRESHNLEADSSHDQDSGAAVRDERVGHTQWAPEDYSLKASDEAQEEDPWRSATYCATVVVDGVAQKACVSVAVLTLDAELAAQLGVAMR